MVEQIGTKSSQNGQKSPIIPVKWTNFSKSGQKFTWGVRSSMQTAPAWVIKPPFRQGEITLTNGGANGNESLKEKDSKMWSWPRVSFRRLRSSAKGDSESTTMSLTCHS